MKCHRTIGPSVYFNGTIAYDRTKRLCGWLPPPLRDCIGSECSAWIPSCNSLIRGCCGLIHDPDDRGVEWIDPAHKPEEATP